MVLAIPRRGCQWLLLQQAGLLPDGKSAVINGGAGVLLINGATGKANSTIVPFKHVVDIDVDWN